MLYNYVALVLFIAFAIFVPVSFLLTAKMLAKKKRGNPVKNSPYESGEETIGTTSDVDNEYLPNFMIFLPFEIVIAMLILWSIVSRSVSYEVSISMIMLGIFATILSFIGYRIGR
jgi:NADH:ubiquinone oxidoreductase subunit 3 (subunit A)